jgi:hypothetical protein
MLLHGTMAGMHHPLILASRIVAGAVAAIAFYFALFLYEDEEGIWQNRIENLWIAVYDRARLRDSLATALFNKIGETLTTLFNRIFGKRFLSIRAALVSGNISLCGVFTTLFFFYVFREPTERSTWIFLFIAIVCAYLASGPASTSDVLDILVSATILLFLLVGSTSLLFTTLPENIDKMFLLNGQVNARTVLEVQPVAFPLSIASDYLTIVLMRKLFAAVHATVSTYRVILTMGILMFFSVCLSFMPMLMLSLIERHAASTPALGLAMCLLGELFFFNISTSIICLIPVALLIVVLLHKLTWPLFSRLLYIVAARRVIENKRAMVLIGGLLTFYAIYPDPINTNNILKLFSRS